MIYGGQNHLILLIKSLPFEVHIWGWIKNIRISFTYFRNAQEFYYALEKLSSVLLYPLFIHSVAYQKLPALLLNIFISNLLQQMSTLFIFSWLFLKYFCISLKKWQNDN